MAIKKFNRFCGVFSKRPFKQEIKQAIWLPYKASSENNITFFSSSEIENNVCIDGFISGLTSEKFDLEDLENCDGNWAVCILSNNKISLSRDRIGVRCIYYFENEDVFCFSNEIKSLLSTGLIPFKVSPSAAFQFLMQDKNEILGDNLFRNINELPPGNNLLYDINCQKLETKTYYKFTPQALFNADIDIVGADIRNQITNIVDSITKETNDIACLLSGGLDSSCLTAALHSNNSKSKMPFLTAMSDDKDLDEVEYAESVARQFKLENWNQILVANPTYDIENLHFAMELPTTSLGSFFQYELNRFASTQGIKFLFDGTGADALYAGHLYHHAVFWNSFMRKWKFGKAATHGASTENTGFWLKYWIKNVMKYYYIPQFSAQTTFKFAARNNPLLKYLNSDFVNDNYDILDKKDAKYIKDLNGFLIHSFFEGSVRTLLRFPDRIGKFFGVSNLSIFSEYRSLYERAFQIPAELKIRNGQLKYVLRSAFKDVLPLDILQRNDKKGLVAPNNRWIKENREYFLSYIDDSLLDYFNVPAMRDAMDNEIQNMDYVENYKLFKFLSFAIWHKVFKNKF